MAEVRESIAYNKDLITGATVELTKYKPALPLAKGIATVELFDSATGKKLYEAKTENIIHNMVSKYAYMDYFYNKIKGNISNNYYTAPFQYLVLTDYSGAEDPDCVIMNGNFLGYADKSTAYAGDDNTRGTINLSETTLDNDGSGTLHFVFDFPTNAGNGTFQTIYWTNSIANSAYLKNTIVPTGLNYSSWAKITVIPVGTKLAIIFSKSFQDISTSPVGYPTWCVVVDPSNNYAVVKTYNLETKLGYNFTNNYGTWGNSDSNQLVFIQTNNGNIALLDINSDTVTVITGVSGSGGTGGIKAIVIGSVIYVAYVGGGKISKYTINGTTATYVKDIYSGGQMNDVWSLQVWKGKGLIVFNVGTKYSQIVNDVFVTISHGHVNYYSQLLDTDKLVYETNSTYDSSTSQAKVSLQVGDMKASIGAMTLLAAPVTKTPTNTMKIQYDFQVQKVL